MGTHTHPRTPGVRFWECYFNNRCCVLFLLTFFCLFFFVFLTLVFCLILLTFAAISQHIHGKRLTELWLTKLPSVCLHAISFSKFLLRWMSWSLTTLPLKRRESVFFLARAGASGEHSPGCGDLSGHELAAARPPAPDFWRCFSFVPFSNAQHSLQSSCGVKVISAILFGSGQVLFIWSLRSAFSKVFFSFVCFCGFWFGVTLFFFFS